jgi:Mg-chelatase subunit ChlD
MWFGRGSVIGFLLFGMACSDTASEGARDTLPADTAVSDGVLFPDAPTSFDTQSSDTAEGPDETSPSDSTRPDDDTEGQALSDISDTPSDTGDIASDTRDAIDTETTGCTTQELTLSVSLAPPSVMLVVDRSGSMYDRWDEAIDAVDALVQQVGNTMRLGLTLYPAASGCGVASEPQVPIGPASEVGILEALRTAGTGGSTPMGRAMSAVTDYLERTPQPGEVNVVLVADGKPSDTCLEDCEGCDCLDNDSCSICADLIACTQLEVSKHVVELAGTGVRTWVIGYEGGFGASDFLASLAEAGGTAGEGPTPFFDAGDGTALGRILSDIAGSVETCTADVVEPAGYGYPVVTLDGVTVPRDPNRVRGWDWLDSDTIRLYGDACDLASQDGAALAISFVCK